MRPRVLLAALILSSLPATTEGADFWAVITNFGDDPSPNAYLDVSFDTRALASGPIAVQFDVFGDDGTNIASFAVAANAQGFVSSALAPPAYRNLFRLSGGQQALVRASTAFGVHPATATLHQRGQGTRMILNVPPQVKSDGTPVHVGRVFDLSVGDLRSAATATLLIANVSGSDVVVDIFTGTLGAIGTGKYSNPLIPNRGVWRVDLQPDDENAHLVVAATAEVIVQLLIDDGRPNALTVVPVR